MKMNEKKLMKALSFELNKSILPEVDEKVAADVVTAAEIISTPTINFKIPYEKVLDFATKKRVALMTNGRAKLNIRAWLTNKNFCQDMQNLVDAHHKACETGDKQGAAAIFNYIAACVKQIGIVINGTGWVHSLGTYAKMLKEKGVEDIKAYVTKSEDAEMGIAQYSPAYDIWFCMNQLTGFVPDYVDMHKVEKDYIPYVSQVPIKMNKFGILEKDVNDADQISTIVANIIFHWQHSKKSTPDDIMAISDDLAAIVCFISEVTIDATKKLPINIIDLPFFVRMSSIKLYHKVSKSKIELSGGGQKGELLVSSNYMDGNPTHVRTNVWGNPIKVKAYNRFTRKQKPVKDQLIDIYSDKTDKIYITDFYDHAYRAEKPLLDYAKNKANWALEILKNVKMPEEIIKQWKAVAIKNQGVFSVFDQMKKVRQTILTNFGNEQSEKAAELGGDTSMAYEKWLEAAKSVKSRFLKTLINTMRYAYKLAGISALDAGRIALAIQYMTANNEEDDTGVADFAAGTIDAETVLALFSDIGPLVDMEPSIEHKLEVHYEDALQEYIGKKVNFKDGMFCGTVNGSDEVIAEFEGDEHVQVEKANDTFTIVEKLDDEGEVAYYGSIDLLSRMIADVEANFGFDINEGIILQLKSLDGETMEEAKKYVDSVFAQARNKEIHLVPYRGESMKNALVVDNKIIGQFKCGGDSTDKNNGKYNKQALSFWNNLYDNKKGEVKMLKAIAYKLQDKKMVTGLMVIGDIAESNINTKELTDNTYHLKTAAERKAERAAKFAARQAEKEAAKKQQETKKDNLFADEQPVEKKRIKLTAQQAVAAAKHLAELRKRGAKSFTL